MYERFEQLLKERGINVAEFCKATGIANSTITDWKKGRYTPKTDKIQKIADFFNVSMDYLMGTDDQKYSDENAELLAMLANNPELLEAIKTISKFEPTKKKMVLALIKELGKDR